MLTIAPMFNLSYVLRREGFKTGEEWLEKDEAYKSVIFSEKDKKDWWKFPDDPDCEKPFWMGEYGRPIAHICVDAETHRIWCDVEPCGSYHACGEELDVITNTIASLAKNGYIWRTYDIDL